MVCRGGPDYYNVNFKKSIWRFRRDCLLDFLCDQGPYLFDSGGLFAMSQKHVEATLLGRCGEVPTPSCLCAALVGVPVVIWVSPGLARGGRTQTVAQGCRTKQAAHQQTNTVSGLGRTALKGTRKTMVPP